MGLIGSLVKVAMCGILDHDLEYLKDWAGRWALENGWYLYRCRRCGKRIRSEEPQTIGERMVDLWP